MKLQTLYKRILKETSDSKLSSLTFNDIKSEFISTINKKLKSAMLALNDGYSTGSFKKVNDVGTYIFNYIKQSEDSWKEFLDTARSSHWGNKKGYNSIQEIVNAMFYQSKNNACIGINDDECFVIK